MEGMAIVRPVTATVTYVSSGTGGNNLTTPSPREIWAASVASQSHVIKLDLGEAKIIDALFVGAADVPVGAYYNVRGGQAADEADAVQLAPLTFFPIGREAGALNSLVTFDPVLVRYLRIEIAMTAPVATFKPSVGILVAGTSFVPTWGREFGGGRQVVDMSAIEPLVGGGFGVGRGARRPGFLWTFGDLLEWEVEELDTLALAVGESQPIIVAEDIAPALGTIVSLGNVTIAGGLGRSLTKAGGANGAFDSGAVIGEGLTGGHVSFSPKRADKAMIVGLAVAPAGVSAAGLKVGLSFGADGTLGYFVDGNPAVLIALGAYAAADDIALVHRPGGAFEVWRNGTRIRVIAAPRGQTYYAQALLISSGAQIDDFRHAPLGMGRRYHYGRFDRLQPWERRNQEQTSWSFTVTDWL